MLSHHYHRWFSPVTISFKVFAIVGFLWHHRTIPYHLTLKLSTFAFYPLILLSSTFKKCGHLFFLLYYHVTDQNIQAGPSSSGPSTSTPANKRARYDRHVDPIEIISYSCCRAECTKSVSYNDIRQTQNTTEHLSESELKTHLFREIQTHTNIKKNNEEFTVNHNFVIYGQSVCPEAWRRINNVSVNKFYDIMDRLKQAIEMSRMAMYNWGRVIEVWRRPWPSDG